MLNFVEYGFKKEIVDAFQKAMYASLAAVNRWQSTMILVVILFAISMFEPFFKIPSFAVVPRTLVKAAPDTMYLIITLITLLLGFGTMMTLKFGAVLERWSDPSRGIVATFFMALGDLSTAFEEAYKLDPQFAFVAFASFSMLISIIIINIFLSVVLDAYSQVKDEIADESTRPSIAKRINKYKGAFKLGSMLNNLKSGESRLTKNDEKNKIARERKVKVIS